MMCNNDCFFSEPNSAVAQRIGEYTHANYRKSYYHAQGKRPSSLKDTDLKYNESTLFFSYQAYLAEETAFIFKSTLEKTGPDAIEKFTDECGRVIDVFVREPLEGSTLSWLGRGVKRFALEEIDAVIEVVFKEIQFEIAHVGVLRLDAHIQNIFDALSCEDENTQANVINSLLSRVQTLDLATVKVAQLTFRHARVQQFLTDNALLSKTFLFPHSSIAEEGERNHYLADIQSVLTIAHQPYAQPQNIDLLPAHLPQRVESSETAAEHATIRLAARSGFLFNLVDFYHQEMQALYTARSFSAAQMAGIQACLQVIKAQLEPMRSNNSNFLDCRHNVDNLELFIQDWLDYNTTSAKCCSFWQQVPMPSFPERRSSLASANSVAVVPVVRLENI